LYVGAHGRLQFGGDLELTFRTLSGHGANPNVYEAVVIGIEPKWTERVASEIARTGKPVEAFSIEGYGDLRTIERASRAAYHLMQEASELEREPVEVRELVLYQVRGERPHPGPCGEPSPGAGGGPAGGRVGHGDLRGNQASSPGRGTSSPRGAPPPRSGRPSSGPTGTTWP